MSQAPSWKESVRLGLLKATEERGVARVGRLIGIKHDRLGHFLAKGYLGSNGVKQVEEWLQENGYMEHAEKPVQGPEGARTTTAKLKAAGVDVVEHPMVERQLNEAMARASVDAVNRVIDPDDKDEWMLLVAHEVLRGALGIVERRLRETRAQVCADYHHDYKPHPTKAGSVVCAHCGHEANLT